jgi:hypothetical protein
MEKLIAKVGEASIVLLSILFLGMLIPLKIALLVYFTTDLTFAECTTYSVMFWLFSFFGWIGSAVYINDTVYKN